uniref:Ion_trans_2 domain-containing protein n=1 Tax=Rhabditophanes sp. KR3021 TaxID=114890 RepID=A0AC35U613_9BILA
MGRVLWIACCHLALYCTVLIYILGGAYIFYYFEGEPEIDRHVKLKQKISELKSEFVQNVINSQDPSAIEECLIKLLGNLTTSQSPHEAHNIHESISILINQDGQIKKQWTYTSCVLFCYTILTTIGYGNVFPTSNHSKLFTMLYGVIGIPLFLITIADAGRFFKTAVFFMYKVIFKKEIKKEGDRKFLRELGEVILVVFLLTGFIATGSAVLPLWESDLTYFQSVYFSYMSLTTIGLGDIVPRRMDFLPLTLVYITIGFWLTTALVEQLADIFRFIHYYGRHVSNVKGITVWLGCRKLSVGSLIQTVCRRVGMSDHVMSQINWDRTLNQVLQGQALETIPIFPWHFSDFIARDPPLIDSSVDSEEFEGECYYAVPTICNSPQHNMKLRKCSHLSHIKNSNFSSFIDDDHEEIDFCHST